MPEITSGNEFTKKTVEIESKGIKQITPEDTAALAKFADQATDEYINATPEMKEETGTTAYVHAQAAAILRNALRDKTHLILSMVKDENNDLRGYSLVTVDQMNENPDNRVLTEFLGVRSSDRGEGIATELLRERIEKLKEVGIRGYTSISRSDAVRVYDRLGVKYEVLPLPSNANFAKDATRIKVQF